MKFIYKYMYSHDIPYMYTCTVYVHVNVKFIKTNMYIQHVVHVIISKIVKIFFFYFFLFLFFIIKLTM